MTLNPLRHRSRLAVVPLEDRATPAQFNTPWPDPSHLTLSFAPDGTPALSAPSSLFSSLDAQMPRATWQLAILRATQAWTAVAGVNIGVTAVCVMKPRERSVVIFRDNVDPVLFKDCARADLADVRTKISLPP